MSGNVWDDIKKGLEDSITFATEKTRELTSAGKLKIAIAGINRKIDSKHRELGKHVFGALSEKKSESFAKDEVAKAFVGEIKELEDELAEKEQELADLGKKEESVEEAETTEIAPEEKP